jgi:hypothetical protein
MGLNMMKDMYGIKPIGPSGLGVVAGYLAPDFRRLQSGLSQSSPSGFDCIRKTSKGQGFPGEMYMFW